MPAVENLNTRMTDSSKQSRVIIRYACRSIGWNFLSFLSNNFLNINIEPVHRQSHPGNEINYSLIL
jgi:hypothetical protein